MLKRLFFILIGLLWALSALGAGEGLWIGTKNGLYSYREFDEPGLLWGEAEVRQIVAHSGGFYLLTGKGVLFSKDMKSFEFRNRGIANQVFKLYDGKEVSYEQQPGPLFDLVYDPVNPDNMAVSSRFGIYVSTDGGLNWSYVANPSYRSGNKAVAIFTINKRLYLVHSGTLRGVFYTELSLKSRRALGWKSLNSGLYKTQVIFEELSDISVSIHDGKVVIYGANSYFPRLYRLNWEKRSWRTIYTDKGDNRTIDSLAPDRNGLAYVTTGKIGYLTLKAGDSDEMELLREGLKSFRRETGERPLSLYRGNGVGGMALNELWLVEPPAPTKYMEMADQKRGLYLPITYARSKERLEQVIQMMKGLELNMVVIDMKDDFGILRFPTDNRMLNSMGLVRNPLDVDFLLKRFKEEGIYVAARMVIFKDPILYRYEGGRLAVKDKSSKKPWQGYYKVKDESGDLIIKHIQEYWVDPYSEEVWEYNVRAAQELIRLGFNEIQFDYIRFPTDGVNLADASYDFQGKGMSKRDALLSFLRFARANLEAPISIDVYGANGWHRMGGTTGQDVELMKEYVDVVCPMFYPSHFSQQFLNYEPYDKRTYRIYYYGAFRNYHIGRGEFLVRPYTQSFKLGVSYDQAYYGHDYVFNQIEGIADSVNQGFTFWDASGRYYYLRKAARESSKM